jgi:hypothetical protein
MTPEMQTNDPYEIFQPGDRVKHPKFGEGTVMQRTGAGEATKLVVAFAEEGEKYLMAKFAKLRKLQPIEGKEEKPAPKPLERPIVEKPHKAAPLEDEEEETPFGEEEEEEFEIEEDLEDEGIEAIIEEEEEEE